MGYIGTGERAVAAQESLDGRRELAPSPLKAWGKDAEQPGGMQWCEGTEAELETPSSPLQTHRLNSLGSTFPLIYTMKTSYFV